MKNLKHQNPNPNNGHANLKAYMPKLKSQEPKGKEGLDWQQAGWGQAPAQPVPNQFAIRGTKVVIPAEAGIQAGLPGISMTITRR